MSAIGTVLVALLKAAFALLKDLRPLIIIPKMSICERVRSMEKSAHSSADKIALYDALVATCRSVERKGDTVPYTAHNGHMFSYLSKSGVLALRLPEDARAAFLKKYNTTLCKQYGVVQKEYVEVPDHLLTKTSELKVYFALAYSYVCTLKAKPPGRETTASPLLSYLQV
jgi:hypothetical protein